MSYMRAPFTLTAGLKVQGEQLARWKLVLKGRAYRMLRDWLTTENAKLPKGANGYDVTRGTSLDEYVHNVITREMKP